MDPGAEEFPDDQSDASEEFDMGDTIEFDDSAVDYFHSSTVGNPPFPFVNDDAPGASSTSQNDAPIPPSANPINWTSYNFAQMNQAAGAAAKGYTDYGSPNNAAVSSSTAVATAGSTAPPSGDASAIKQYAAKLFPSGPYTSGGSWDPLGSADWDSRKPSDFCLGRIARDLHSLYTDPIAGVMVHAYESNVTKMMALISGPEGTPYAGGHFLFFMRFPPDYPIKSPRVRILTTGGGVVRFNPNLYANGKVCLSLLGTWSGPAWSPVLNTSSLLLSIQSLLGENPYQNEPGYEKVAPDNPTVRDYNDHIQYETIRIAVIDLVEKALQPGETAPKAGKAKMAEAGDSINLNVLPERFSKVILTAFLKNYDKHIAVIESHKIKDQDQVRTFLHDAANTKYCWLDLAAKMPPLKTRVEAVVASWNKRKAEDEGMGDGNEDDKVSD